MKDVALIFPGQGAQKVGMGQDLYDGSPAARSVFDKANEVLGESLTKIIFEGPEEKLMATAYCQSAIFSMSMAALEAMKNSKVFGQLNVKFTAGLSLGEYGAMCAAGAISFEDSLRLIQKRGSFMDEACKLNQGTMAAVIGFDKDKIVEICAEAGCEVANFNAPDQIVITGLADKVGAACIMLTNAGAKRVMPLGVAGAFHSSLMQTAADQFMGALDGVSFDMGLIQVISNVTGKPQTTSEEIVQNLPRQITSSVQWVDSIEYMVSQGITDFIEIGPGRVLKGLLRKIDPSLNVQNIQTLEDVGNLAV